MTCNQDRCACSAATRGIPDQRHRIDTPAQQSRRRLFNHVNTFTVTCALSVHKVAAEGHVMTQPAKRIPTWLTIDVLVIVISLAIIAIGIAIGITP